MKKNFTPFKILPEVLSYKSLSCNALCFLPESEKNSPYLAIFTHGFTASKTDVLNWSARLLDLNIPSIIFDLPGHLLGSFSKSPTLEEFLSDSPQLFLEAFKILKNKWALKDDQANPPKLIIGGHSLGALFAIKSAAIETDSFNNNIEHIMAVGFGLNDQVKTHLFESDLYQKTLHLRGQLVSPEISHEKVLKWIREQKLDLPVRGKKIFLLSGKDDAVVGPNGAEILKQHLSPFNEVTLETPEQLPHHRPELAAAHLYHYLKKNISHGML
ncbi:MAG: alpha/beta fold hydrolase [Bacteriovoracaceae bacterium]|nr:alpha/beta fold hydrolase [Bacteriovoracaceae bacterium]